ncbi:MAG: hypothetical protein U1F16_08230 [Turneriella sp.]
MIIVSSPNTPNLRALQKGETIRKLVSACAKVSPRPVVVKSGRGFSRYQNLSALTVGGTRWRRGGIIICNTTTNHSIAKIPADLSNFDGGLSGKALAEKIALYLKETIKVTKGKVPVISSGGIYAIEEAAARLGSSAPILCRSIRALSIMARISLGSFFLRVIPYIGTCN